MQTFSPAADELLCSDLPPFMWTRLVWLHIAQTKYGEPDVDERDEQVLKMEAARFIGNFRSL